MSESSSESTGSLELTPLVPVFDAEQHGTYRDELVSLLGDDRRRERVWNIALAGGYGSGKSSILAGVRDVLGRRVVEISLSSLSDVGVLPHKKGSEELNNYIQKEIVKQLLYRERPSRVPGSRFKRISRMSWQRALGASVLTGVAVVALLWLTGWGAPFKLNSDQEWLRPLLLLLVGLVATGVTYFGQVLFHNRVRIDKLGTSATSVTLSTETPAGSYFDEYLDEIVYFFEQTGRDIVILEDLDRFEDPGIYASLRELNTILNSSAQLGRRPVHFIYAVRDSIFKDLQPASKNVKDEAPRPVEAESGVWQAARDLSDAATQRTKFFELVIPIVPFITHRSSADLLYTLVRDVDTRISYEAVRTVAKHVTDMRLLHNILNEYRVFRARVLTRGKIQGLAPTQLFALVAYKNTHLEDFELIRVGSSDLDTIYRRSRGIIAATLEDLSVQIERLQETVEPDPATVERAEQLGSALQELAERWLEAANHARHGSSYWMAGTERASDTLATVEFWEEFIDTARSLVVRVSGEQVFVLTPESLRADLGRLVPDRWVVQANDDARHSLDRARVAQRWVQTADFAGLISPQTPLQLDGSSEDFDAWLRERIGVDPLLYDMLIEGLLDRNFTLYASEFYGVVASAEAMNYVVQHVQTDRPDHDYPLTPEDVDSVLELSGARVFESVGIFNTSVYDVLIGRSDQRLTTNLKLLADGSAESISFLRAYVRRGAHPDDVLRRLTPYWRGIFEFIESETDDNADLRASLAVAAFEGINVAVEYTASDSIKALIAAAVLKIDDLTMEGRSPDRIVAALQHLGIRLRDLSDLSPAAREAVIHARQYEVNATNLEIAARGGDVALDAIMQLNDPTFDHVLRYFDDYLSVLDTTGRSSITDVSMAVEVMEAVDRAHPAGSIDLARRMPDGMMVDNLEGVSSEILVVLARTRRFPLTFANVTIYVGVRALD